MNRADEIRELIKRLNLSQRRAAETLGIQEREFRHYCAGKPCPVAIVFALRYLMWENTNES